MDTGRIIRLATSLAAAYKEVPYSVLYAFLREQTEKAPQDRVLQHMGAIIEKRFAAQPMGTILVKEIDGLIGELSSFGDTAHCRALFSSYFTKTASYE